MKIENLYNNPKELDTAVNYLDHIFVKGEYCQSLAELALQIKTELLEQEVAKQFITINFESSNSTPSIPIFNIEKSTSQQNKFDLDDTQKQELIGLCRDIFLHPSSKLEANDGLHCIELGELKLAVLILSGSIKSGRIILWQVQEGVAFPGPILSAAARFWQLTAHWLRRLEESQELVYRDDLTQLYNYRYFEILLEAEIRRAQRFNHYFSLLFLDIDNFKLVNDLYGHLNGSSLLKQLGDLFKTTLREVDSIIRYGGDEFVVLLIGASSARAFMVAERLRNAVAAHNFMLDTGKSVNITLSIGIASYPQHAKTKSEIVKLADASMYKSKKQGKNRTTLVENSSSL
ncbi:MAG: GGDEF domain-containing protein [Oligoflexales bacterium]|nr:GGDEF domain-containing protein [Oligoflexales bacterium]